MTYQLWKRLFLALALVPYQAAIGQHATAKHELGKGAEATNDHMADSSEVAPTSEAVAAYLQSTYDGQLPPEGMRMLMAITSGSQMQPGEGWFGPAATRFDYAWLAKHCGVANPADGISKEKFRGSDDAFAMLDRNRDGSIQDSDLDWSDSNPYVEMLYSVNRIYRRIDAKGTGKLSKEDWLSFFDRASGKDGLLSPEDFSGVVLAGYGGSFAPGDGPDTQTLIRGLFAGEIGSMLEGPKIGQRAPVFQLPTVDGYGTIDMGSLLGEKPLVIVFGNFTCGPFRAFYPAVDALHAKYGDRANFLMVYVREAHPANGWKMESNTRAGVDVAQPTTLGERTEVAKRFCSRLHPNMPVVVDELSDPVGHAYSGMPARLYVIDTKGNVAFKSGRGPFGFKPPELEQALVMSLLESAPNEPAAANLSPQDPTWQLLPKTVHRSSEQLPNWVAPMAQHLPRTAAAMLRLDYAHRTKSPLDSKLRAKMRWVIANANRCQYSAATAQADLKRAGASDAEIDALRAELNTSSTNVGGFSGEDSDALQFAFEHTLDAPNISDALFERLRVRYGERSVAAMVLLGAYGNFQDRILLGLHVPLEESGPLAPLEVEFVADAFQTQPILPAKSPIAPFQQGGIDVVEDPADWASLSYDDLQERLRAQTNRAQRLPTPTWEQVASKLPPEFNARPTRIVWNLVCMGYVPELALPWSTTTRTMWAEAPQDRVLEESLFWVQTRAIECNYCMGHCEMLLEVAGMNRDQIRGRIERLASDDWSAFPESEQRAYAFARRLTKTPWAVTPADIAQLEKDYGATNATAIFFWLCRGLYMTRVSDGFQLQLETDNVFEDYAKRAETK
ncbi:MAG: deiodinase family protein [Pirellula sp.]